MTIDKIVEKSIEINAGIEKVWKALTTPEIIKKYFFGTETISDWKVGSQIVFQGEWEGQKYRDHGTILKFEVNRIFQYDYWSNFSGFEDKPENYTRITFELSLINNQTKLSLIQDHFITEKQFEHSGDNWEMILGKIKELTED
jgi:uncharacterized protein YndB with AHSA1/START domain